MPQVMQQSGGEHFAPLFWVKAQDFRHFRSDMICAKRMLQPGVVRARENEMGQTELVNAMESLHLWSAKEL